LGGGGQNEYLKPKKKIFSALNKFEISERNKMRWL